MTIALKTIGAAIGTLAIAIVGAAALEVFWYHPITIAFVVAFASLAASYAAMESNRFFTALSALCVSLICIGIIGQHYWLRILQ